MTFEQKRALSLRETDVEGALRRFSGNEKLYISCLLQFLDDKTIFELNLAIEKRMWDEAFTAAHALKGLAGNLGFVQLMQSMGHLVIMIRGGRTIEAKDFMETVNSNYRDITDAIKNYFTTENR